jgi:hypothetical protein
MRKTARKVPSRAAQYLGARAATKWPDGNCDRIETRHRRAHPMNGIIYLVGLVVVVLAVLSFFGLR